MGRRNRLAGGMGRRNRLIVVAVASVFALTIGFTGTPLIAATTRRIRAPAAEVLRPTPPDCRLSSFGSEKSTVPVKSNVSTLFMDIQRYATSLPNTQEQFFKYISKSLRQPWKKNQRKSMLFKRQFSSKNSSVCVCDRLMLSRKNTPLGLEIPKVHANGTYKVTSKTLRYLPTNSSLPAPPYGSCSVIGSSGILRGSQCGRVIDATDHVFRFNLAPTLGFEEDVGNKTFLTTMNPSVYNLLYGRLKDKENETRFAHYLGEQKGFVWTPALAFTRNTLGMLGRIKNIAKANEDLHFIAGDPMHFKAIVSFWSQYGLNSTISSGFYFINMALALCSDVHVFGFWPFNTTTHGTPVGYHYYNHIDFTNNHDMSFELKLVTAMHHYGLLRMHIGECSEHESNSNAGRTSTEISDHGSGIS